MANNTPSNKIKKRRTHRRQVNAAAARRHNGLPDPHPVTQPPRIITAQNPLRPATVALLQQGLARLSTDPSAPRPPPPHHRHRSGPDPRRSPTHQAIRSDARARAIATIVARAARRRKMHQALEDAGGVVTFLRNNAALRLLSQYSLRSRFDLYGLMMERISNGELDPLLCYVLKRYRGEFFWVIDEMIREREGVEGRGEKKG